MTIHSGRRLRYIMRDSVITGNQKLNAESAAFSPDGRLMLLTEANGNISTYDLSSSLKAPVGSAAACCNTYANVRQQADIARDGSVAWFEAESSRAQLGAYAYDHPEGHHLRACAHQSGRQARC